MLVKYTSRMTRLGELPFLTFEGHQKLLQRAKAAFERARGEVWWPRAKGENYSMDVDKNRCPLSGNEISNGKTVLTQKFTQLLIQT